MPVKKEVSCAGAQMPGVGCDPFTSKNGWQVHSGLLADHSNLCLSKVSNYRDISDHSIETISFMNIQYAKGNGLLLVAQTRVLRSATMPLCCSCKFLFLSW